jgi:hypothetical protein
VRLWNRIVARMKLGARRAQRQRELKDDNDE